jgi:hypothetical protein
MNRSFNTSHSGLQGNEYFFVRRRNPYHASCSFGGGKISVGRHMVEKRNKSDSASVFCCLSPSLCCWSNDKGRFRDGRSAVFSAEGTHLILTQQSISRILFTQSLIRLLRDVPFSTAKKRALESVHHVTSLHRFVNRSSP